MSTKFGTEEENHKSRCWTTTDSTFGDFCSHFCVQNFILLFYLLEALLKLLAIAISYSFFLSWETIIFINEKLQESHNYLFKLSSKTWFWYLTGDHPIFSAFLYWEYREYTTKGGGVKFTCTLFKNIDPSNSTTNLVGCLVAGICNVVEAEVFSWNLNGCIRNWLCNQVVGLWPGLIVYNWLLAPQLVE